MISAFGVDHGAEPLTKAAALDGAGPREQRRAKMRGGFYRVTDAPRARATSEFKRGFRGGMMGQANASYMGANAYGDAAREKFSAARAKAAHTSTRPGAMRAGIHAGRPVGAALGAAVRRPDLAGHAILGGAVVGVAGGAALHDRRKAKRSAEEIGKSAFGIDHRS